MGRASFPPSTASAATVPATTNLMVAADAPSSGMPQQKTAPAGAGRGRGRGRRQSKDTDPCRTCHQLGYWTKECPQRRALPVIGGLPASQWPPTRIYVAATSRGRPLYCLLDTGCKRSLVSSHYAKDLQLTKTDIKLYTAVKSQIPIEGDVDFRFAIDGQELVYNVTVSPVVDELILGSDWLTENNCQWDFATGKLTLNGREVKTFRREQLASCRRIFVRENCVVSPRHEANVPVRLASADPQSELFDWAVEPRTLHPGVATARVLVNDDNVNCVARVLNYSDEPYTLEAESFFSMAEPVDALDGHRSECQSRPLGSRPISPEGPAKKRRKCQAAAKVSSTSARTSSV